MTAGVRSARTGALARQAAPAGAATAVFLVVVALYVAHLHAIHASLLTLWGMRPFRFPFLDADTVMSALRCRRMGVDVFAVNPCDALGRVYDYSPLWLHLSAFPFTEAWVVPVGLAFCAAFLASLLLLPPGRDWGRTLVIVAGVLSTPVVFALERANNDLVIFALAALMAALCCKGLAWRAVGYGCAFLAGLLKYYPMLLMAAAVRERPPVFAAVAAIALLAFGTFIGLEYEALRRALELIPTGSYFGDMFGAKTLPSGLAEMGGLSPLLGRVGEVGLDVLCVGLAVWFSLRAQLDLDLRALTERERTFLLAGALLTVGCFFTAQNIGYRALHIVLALPALTALSASGRHRVVWTVSAGIAFVLLWAEAWRHLLDSLIEGRPLWAEWQQPAVDLPRLVAWGLREACWWWMVTVLLSVTFALLRHAPAVELALRTLSSRRATGGLLRGG